MLSKIWKRLNPLKITPKYALSTPDNYHFDAYIRVSVDSMCTRNNSCYRRWSALARLEPGAAWMGWCISSHNIWHHHILHFQSLSRMLQMPSHWQEKLYLYAGCQSQSRYYILLIHTLNTHVYYKSYCKFFLLNFSKIQVEKCIWLVGWLNTAS